MRRVILHLLAGVILCCLGLLLSLPVPTPEVPSAFEVSGEDGGVNAPVPDGTYPLTPAEEVQETHKHPVNASLLTMLLLAIASFGVSVLWLHIAKARMREAICSWGVEEDRAWLAKAPEGMSFLGVFRL